MFTTTLIVLVINVLSRGMALVANSFITASFGATAQTSAYSFALTLTNIITTVIGTTLTTSVVPIYTDLREKHSRKRTFDFLNNTISLTVIVSIVLVLIGSLAAPLFAKMAKDGDYGFTIYAIRILLYSIIFIALYYILSGLLQANNRFYLAAAVSIPSSLVSIIYLTVFAPKFGMKGLCVATLIGFFLQFFILVPAIRKIDYRFSFSFNYKNEDMFKIFKVVAPVIVGVCAHQINLLTNGSIAFSHDANRYVVLNNAQNLGVQIVMTIVLAITSVVYPKMSTLHAKGDPEGLNEQFLSTLSGSVLLLLPVNFAFYIYSYDIMDLVYGYGKFTASDVALGGTVFSLYSFSVLGIALKEITDRAFYALKNTKTPAYNGVLIMAVNIILSAVTVKFWGLAGIAFAYSVAALCGGINIFRLFKKKNAGISIKPVATAFLKAVIGCVIMSIVIILVKNISFGDGKVALIMKMGISGILGLIAYGVTLILLKTKEIKSIIKF